jgi:rod shape-determining protein MreB
VAAGLPRKMEITSEEIREALSQPIQQIVEAVRSCLDNTPPELASDLLDSGITLVGGGSMLPGLDQLLEEQTGLSVQLAEDPITCVARGTIMLLEKLDQYEDVLTEEPE